MRFKEAREVGKRFQQRFSHYVSGCSVTMSPAGKLVIKADLKRPLPEGFKLPNKFEDVEIIVGIVNKAKG